MPESPCCLDLLCLFAEVHEEVTGLLGGPRARWMLGDPEDADAPGRVFYHRQDVVWVPETRATWPDALLAAGHSAPRQAPASPVLACRGVG